MLPIADRITPPSPKDIRAARKAAELTQKQAAALVSPAKGKASYRSWQPYEAETCKPGHRTIPLSTWELFLLLTGQHPTMKLTQKRSEPRQD